VAFAGNIASISEPETATALVLEAPGPSIANQRGLASVGMGPLTRTHFDECEPRTQGVCPLDYTIAAIPTVYRGRQYRSRLEARWAAFFDLLEWEHEYEPYDLGKWSPDFLLTLPTGRSWLVEVKPINEFSQYVADRMVGAASSMLTSGPQFGGVVLFGVSPRPDAVGAVAGYVNPVQEKEQQFDGWRPNYLAWYASRRTPRMWATMVRKDVLEDRPLEFRAYTEAAMLIWAEATNQSQWSGARA
jgi:hypothetical protein